MSDKKIFKAKILNREIVANGTMALTVEKPRGYSFKPGQYTIIHMDEKTDYSPIGGSRYMSFASHPEEDGILFVARLGESRFKKEFENRAIGKELFIEEAQGNFVINRNHNKCLVFIAGGVGITPIRSILLDLMIKNKKNMLLFYSNRKVEDAAFLKEFSAFEKQEKLNFTPTFTKEEIHTTNGKSKLGYINLKMIKEQISDFNSNDYFIVGSHNFLNAMKAMLLVKGVMPEKIISEIFCGYCADHPWNSCCCEHEK